ncbi:hypothetical protein JHK86_001524 [Glycine max]|nr:hypothetical protein JHK86_001524 [Glycine max]
MSTGSQSSTSLLLLTASVDNGESSSDNKQPNTSAALDSSQTEAIETAPRKSIDTFGQRTSIYRDLTGHRWTGRYEAHLWDNSCRRDGQTRKGRQGSIQERLNVLMSRTQNLWNEVTFPLAKPGQTRKPDPENDCGFQVMEDILMIEQTIDRRTPCGVLSLAAVICIEQFSRTGTDITAECVKNRYHIKFQSFLNFLRRGFYALVPTKRPVLKWENNMA